MILFPEGFLLMLVHGALVLTLGGNLALWVLLVRDWRSGRLW